jgi:hypothetical protein
LKESILKPAYNQIFKVEILGLPRWIDNNTVSKVLNVFKSRRAITKFRSQPVRKKLAMFFSPKSFNNSAQ